MGLEGKGGLVIRSVDEGSFAEDIGLIEKDVILAINRKPVSTVEDVMKIQTTLETGRRRGLPRYAGHPGRPRPRAPMEQLLRSRTLPPQ